MQSATCGARVSPARWRPASCDRDCDVCRKVAPSLCRQHQLGDFVTTGEHAPVQANIGAISFRVVGDHAVIGIDIASAVGAWKDRRSLTAYTGYPDVFEDQCRPAQCHVRPGNRAYFFVPVDPRRDPFQFAGSFECGDP